MKRWNSLPKDSAEARYHHAMGALLYGRLGEIDEARLHLDALLSDTEDGPVPFVWLAIAYAGVGDSEKSYEMLMKSTDERSSAHMIIRTHPLLEGLRSDPRFAGYVAKLRVQS